MRVDPARFTRFDAADVYKAGVLAGELRRSPAGTFFRYHPDYLDGPGPDVATSLPRSEAPVSFPGGAVPPFFAGLLPEGRRLTALRSAVKTSADDELSLLLAVGRDTVGDVQILPPGSEPAPVAPLIEVQTRWDEARFADLVAEAGIVDPVGIPGIQDKVSARMIAVPVARSGERFILKIDPPEFPHVVENEAYFLRLARHVRLPAARASVVRDIDDRPGLLVTRFDRLAKPDGSSGTLACEDACQVLGRWPADKYLVSAEESVVALADRCAARPVALRALLQQVCFAWLTGNGDQHAKNLSILATPEGEWRVSPAYDVPTTVPYGDTTTALTIGGRTRGLTRRHLLGFAEVTGLPAAAAEAALDDLIERLGDLEDAIRDGALPFGQQRTSDLAAELRYRLRQARG